MAEIKQGSNKFYIGDDENNPQAQITFQPQVNFCSLLLYVIKVDSVLDVRTSK